jgi:hypothetical protein|uniref:Uncharacterized protein n=1 Tax=virus sp. ctPYc18 TaxID=2828251 RepID=A0A8S5RCB2_9VIRU|nr:MAG TPA: hypothetical protein [virus sp. ctPYc18]
MLFRLNVVAVAVGTSLNLNFTLCIDMSAYPGFPKTVASLVNK